MLGQCALVAQHSLVARTCSRKGTTIERNGVMDKECSLVVFAGQTLPRMARWREEVVLPTHHEFPKTLMFGFAKRLSEDVCPIEGGGNLNDFDRTIA